LSIGPGLSVLSAQAKAVLASSSPSALILNLESIASIDSAGLGELMNVYTITAKQTCKLVVAAAAPQARNLLQFTQVDRLIPCFFDERTALAVLSKK
jgi:anti-anti-sigma factor